MNLRRGCGNPRAVVLHNNIAIVAFLLFVSATFEIIVVVVALLVASRRRNGRGAGFQKGIAVVPKYFHDSLDDSVPLRREKGILVVLPKDVYKLSKMNVGRAFLDRFSPSEQDTLLVASIRCEFVIIPGRCW